jgi:hypothetical protein
VDLWLHTYAMLAPDTMPLPYFVRGYRERMARIRGEQSVITLLEKNRATLIAGIAANPSLATSGQFVPLYFPSWEKMLQVIGQFVSSGARPTDATQQMYFAVLAGAFPTTTDRIWLRQFADVADDENRLFYASYWNTENQRYGLELAYVDSLWQQQWRPGLQRYLNNTQQKNGDIYLSRPIGGEGRTARVATNESAVVVPAPMSRGESETVLYVIAHEIAGNAANAAIADNTTPAEQRAGTTSRYEQAAAVRAGAMLLERTNPMVVPGYMRYYLQQAGRSTPTDPHTAFLATFAIPDAVRDAIKRQLDVILGGI